MEGTPIAIDTFIAGRYSSTYNAQDCGVTENGYELSMTSAAEMIDETDAYGQSCVDWVYRGGNAFLAFESKAYKVGAYSAMWPYGSLGVVATTAAPIGRLASAIAQAIVLTAVANTPAAATPATLTASKSLLAPNFDGRLLYNSKLRKVPVRLQLLPTLDGSNNLTWFTQT